MLNLAPAPDSSLDIGDKSNFLTDYEIKSLFYLNFDSFDSRTPVQGGKTQSN